jgi:glycosyltransferase involved in cell wall biosynthesis
MRIALVISSLSCGGAERILSLMANYWAEKGNEVAITTLDRGEEPFYPLHPGVERHALGLMKKTSSLFGAAKGNYRRVAVLRRALFRQNADAIISFIEATNILTILAVRIPPRLPSPVIVSERVDPRNYSIPLAWRILRKHTYPLAEQVVTNSHSVRDWLTRNFNLMNVRTIPNAVDIQSRSEDHPAERLSSEIRNEGPWVISMGRLVSQKGFDMLLDAFSRISSQFPQWKLGILGNGPLRTKLLEEAKRMRLEDRVHLFGSFRNPMSILRRADIFVLASRFEGFPNALLEAMASGLPPISFDCPSGPSEIVQNGDNGILVPPEDIQALADSMARLMSDESLRTKMAINASKILDRFRIDRIMAKWNALLAELTTGD